MKKLAISALARSATTFTKQLLEEVGFITGHESVPNNRAGPNAVPVWGEYEIDVGYASIPFLKEFSEDSDVCVVYQWRNPLDQISSFYNFANHYWTTKLKDGPFIPYLYKHTPDLEEISNAKDWVIQYWYQWVARAAFSLSNYRLVA